jgi:hypothetical protein
MFDLFSKNTETHEEDETRVNKNENTSCFMKLFQNHSLLEDVDYFSKYQENTHSTKVDCPLNVYRNSKSSKNALNITKNFKMPITYLESTHIHEILPTTANDLELVQTNQHDSSTLQSSESLESKTVSEENEREKCIKECGEANRCKFSCSPSFLKSNDLDDSTGDSSSYTCRFSKSEAEVKTHFHSQSPENEERKSMYEYLFRPTHEFAKQLLPEWGKNFTSNVEYLKDTQNVILNMKHYEEKDAGGSAPGEAAKPPTSPPPSKGRDNPDHCSPSDFTKEKCSNIINIWKCLKNDDFFLDKYGYMDWSILLYLNRSSSFLQWLTMVNLLSPITSLLIPIVLLIFPFLLLKLQQIPIDFTTYMKVLGEIANNHVIGKMLNIQNISYDKLVYLFFSIAMYILQIYQNINFCFSFYKNITKINQQLYDIQSYVSMTIQNMKIFIDHNTFTTYAPFVQELDKNKKVLIELEKELVFVKNKHFNPILHVHEMGSMLRMYYELYSNIEYENALLYSFGFEGYLDNLSSIWKYYKTNNINKSTFSNDVSESPLNIKGQYYIPYMNGKYVTNDCDLKHNMIISGVNASGKTTFLKTTTLNILFSQQFGMGFFYSMVFVPYTQIHSYLNIPDTSDRDSLFQAESRRCKDIIDIINSNKSSRHFCIFDELYSGTNPSEASKSAYAFLLYLSKYTNVDFMITTHYTIICKKLEKRTKLKKYAIQKKIKNYQTEVAQSKDGSIKYKYKLKPGICRIQGAIEVLKNMNYPKDIIENYLKF